MPVTRHHCLGRCVPPSLRLAAAGFALLLAAPSAAADLGQRLERLERWHGFGWGDGYHSCYDSGPRPFADMPPRPYASDAARHRRARSGDCAPAAAAAPTFYDRFDAGLVTPGPSVLATPPGSPPPEAARSADAESAPNRPPEAVETPEAAEAPGAKAAPPPPAEQTEAAAGANASPARPRIVGLHSTGPRQ